MRWLELKVPPVALVLFLGAAMWGLAVTTPTVDSPIWLRAGFAALLMLKGAWLAVAGVLAFRRAETTVNPMAPQETQRVVEGGIYRYTRNPMYLGFAFALLGWAIWLAAPWALLGPVVFVAWMTSFQIRPEERALEARFGSAYRDYRSRVRRWI
jgi:protein-S-isoprenylcysteine O-methyltransferase Ste14